MFVQVWDLKALRLVSTFTEHSKPVLKLQYNNGILYSIGGATMRLWDSKKQQCILSILTASSHSAGAIRAITIHEDQTIFVGSQVNTYFNLKYNSVLDTLILKTLVLRSEIT